jgi:hypothetical protein
MLESKDDQQAHDVENLSFALLSVAREGRHGFFASRSHTDIRQTVSRALMLALFLSGISPWEKSRRPLVITSA